MPIAVLAHLCLVRRIPCNADTAKSRAAYAYSAFAAMTPSSSKARISQATQQRKFTPSVQIDLPVSTA